MFEKTIEWSINENDILKNHRLKTIKKLINEN